MFIRNPFNYDMDAASVASGCEINDVSLTKQSFAEECDINTLVKRFGITGQLPTDVRMPLNADFDSVIDFQSAMNAIRDAEESFDALPAHVRERFNNNAGAFVDFCSKEENRAEAEKLGMVRPEVLAAREAAARAAAAAAAQPATAAVVAPVARS